MTTKIVTLTLNNVVVGTGSLNDIGSDVRFGILNFYKVNTILLTGYTCVMQSTNPMMYPNQPYMNNMNPMNPMMNQLPMMNNPYQMQQMPMMPMHVDRSVMKSLNNKLSVTNYKRCTKVTASGWDEIA